MSLYIGVYSVSVSETEPLCSIMLPSIWLPFSLVARPSEIGGGEGLIHTVCACT